MVLVTSQKHSVFSVTVSVDGNGTVNSFEEQSFPDVEQQYMTMVKDKLLT